MQSATAGRRLPALTFACVSLWSLLVLGGYFWPSSTLLDRIEWRTVDWRFHLRPRLQPRPDLVIVAVDEESIRQVGRWPWPRSRFATLIDRLSGGGAKRIVFDIFFTERDTASGGAASDLALVDATRRAGIAYHSGFAYVPGSSPPPLPDAITRRAWKHTPVVRSMGLGAVASLIEPSALTFPLPALAEASRGFGVANVLDSGDGIYRHLVPLVRYGNAIYPSVALALSTDLLGVPPSQVRVIPGECVELGKKGRIPLDMAGRMLINFVGLTHPASDDQANQAPGHSYQYVSAAEILSDNLPRDTFRDKIVLVGATAPGIYDLRATPFATDWNGVESEANAIDNILSNRFLRQVPPPYTAVVVLAVLLIFGLVLPRVSTPLLCPLALGLMIGYPWLGTYLFSKRGLVIDLVAPTTAMLGSFLFILMIRLLVEERRRHLAHSALRHFVPPQLVGRLVEEQALTTMRGERREVSVLFADLRNFTASAEELAPEDTVVFLNRYFSLMHEVIWEHGGTLDKYMGDEIMVFHNAPLAQPDHARRCVMTAIDMQRRIMANQAEWEYLRVPGLNAGIGIATGPAVVGYVGSEERMQYTVIGRTVNLASRLQALCKQMQCRLLISDSTYQAVADLVEVEDLGEIALQGFQHPVHVWHVLDYKHADLRGNWAPIDTPVRRDAQRVTEDAGM